MGESIYQIEREKYERAKLSHILEELPEYMKRFFVSIDSTVTIKTQVAYAQDLKTFLLFEAKSNPILKNQKIKNIPLELFDKITPTDIEDYLSYLSGYDRNGEWRTNSKEAKQRKLAALRAFYKNFSKKGFLKSNPAAAVDMPTLDKKAIIALTEEEVKDLLSVVEDGYGLSKKQAELHKKTACRDVTIFSLLLGTGMRISELVGINLGDIDLGNKKIRVIRKGGDEEIICLSDELADKVEFYIEADRPKYIKSDNDEQALFMSLKGKRISIRQIQEMTKKYAEIAVPLKHITPHKMRSTFGSFIYNQTGDPALVAQMLGHASTDITMKRYAKMDTRRVEQAAELASKLISEE